MRKTNPKVWAKTNPFFWSTVQENLLKSEAATGMSYHEIAKKWAGTPDFRHRKAEAIYARLLKILGKSKVPKINKKGLTITFTFKTIQVDGNQVTITT